MTGPADKPEKAVGEHDLLVPGPTIVPAQGLDVSVTAIESRPGPVKVSATVATELVNVCVLELVTVCSGITLPPTPVSDRPTLVSVPPAGSNSQKPQVSVYGTLVAPIEHVWVIVAADMLPPKAMQQIPTANHCLNKSFCFISIPLLPSHGSNRRKAIP